MQTVGSPLQAVLDARERDLIVLYEIYASDYDPTSGFDPNDAEQTFAGTSYTLPYGSVVYSSQVLQGPAITKTIKKQINSVSIKFSNVSRDMAAYVLGNRVEGKKLAVRVLSRSVAFTIGNSATVLNNAPVIFAGRCEKPDGFDRKEGTISAKQDLGTIEAVIPARIFQQSCPLEFKGTECLGTELLSEKSATYQNAATCNFSFRQCDEYENTEFFQGTRIVQITSSFVHKSHVGFWSKVARYGFGVVGFLLAPKRGVTTVGNSTHDGTPYGNAVPVILGRWFKQLIPLQYQDIGNSINFKMAACRGKIHDFINVRCESTAFTQPIGLTKHLGEYGGDGSQTADTVFPDHSFHSRLAYVTGYCNGTAIETEDPAPPIAAVVAGAIPDRIYFDVDHDGTGKLAAGTGGVSLAGSSVSAPGVVFASFDAWMASVPTEARWKLYETDPPGPLPNLDCIDSSGNDHHGSLIPNAEGGLVQGLTGPTETDSPSFGMSGAIARIPAEGSTTGALTPSGTQLTIACNAIRGSAGGVVQFLVGHGGDTVNSYVSFGQRSTGNFSTNVVFSLELEDDGFLLVSQTVSADVWHRIICVRDGALMAIFIDGCLNAWRTDLPADSDIEMQDAPWRLGYMTNAVFGRVNRSSGLSQVSIHPAYAFSVQDVSNDWASAELIPTGCPGTDWTDNPVDHTRWLLTEASALNIPENQINDELSAYAAAWNCGAIKDDTNAERGLLPDSEISRAGVEYQRYLSTGLLGPRSFESTRTQIPAGVPARSLVNNGAGGDSVGEFEFYNPTATPESLGIEVVHRKRFTCNIELTQPKKVLDVIYDTIFPTFGGFLRWDNKGRIVTDSERPADWTRLHAASIVGATTLTVRDVLPWKNVLGSPYLLEGKLHIDFALTWSYDNENVRELATGFVAGDVGKYARQKDNNTLWQLTATTPVWTQVTTLTSEVRSVTAAVYSSLGDAITLAASASGGPSAVASGATLAGGSTTVQSSGTVTITGSLTSGSSITVTIDGVECVLILKEGETSAIIGHRMACVINAEPGLNEYVEAHAVDNVVTVYSKLGVLTLSSALENAHSVNTELTRVMNSFAGKALTYAATIRANILDGSFEWPEASRQPIINQIKASHREAVLDFAEYPKTINDFDHQRSTVKTNPHEVDHQAIDNYNTSARRANVLLNRFRDGDRFFKLGSTGRALLLDEGDVICASDASGPYRNVLMRIEDVSINNKMEARFTCRLYSRDQYSDLVPNPVDTQLVAGLPNFEHPPPVISFNEADFPPNGLVQSTDGAAGITSIRGGVVFSASLYAQYGKIRLIKRAGVTVDESINDRLVPNSDLQGVFEFVASADGLYTVQAQACNQWGCSAVVTADIVIGFGALELEVPIASVVFSAIAPTVVPGATSLTVPVASMALTAPGPSIDANAILTVPTASLSLEAIAPTVTTTDPSGFEFWGDGEPVAGVVGDGGMGFWGDGEPVEQDV